jgi:hypothetical protein
MVGRLLYETELKKPLAIALSGVGRGQGGETMEKS